jgi:NADPH:quinone reductase-like Zn-dependent oxidoreductase
MLVAGAAALFVGLGDIIVARFIEHDQVRPVIDSVMPVSQVAEAHRRLQAGGVKDKIVLTVANE